MSDTGETFLNALELAQAQLLDLELRYNQMTLERHRLQDLVASLRNYLGIEGAVDSPPEDTVPTKSELKPLPAWAWVKSILNDAGRPMSVAEIHSELLSKGIGTISKDVIRVNLNRKNDIFSTNGAGQYFLAVASGVEKGGPAILETSDTVSEMQEA